ncbi:glutathione S-transferase 2-like [Chenopodium quinoa]|uniref:glutathione S-transferase 2-like n=1 Tax=Chenopodium quinoa TaxID=63459 RepID=UPI000B797FAE|nr:glutathione S-transferase 2-like [Chenopodium quinoa]
MASFIEEAEQKPKKIQLYSWWRSSASARVRIALNLKGIEFDYKEVNILKGDQFKPEFVKMSPRSFVPVLVDGDSVIFESSAIIMYLEEKYPQPSLLPPPNDLPKRVLNYQVANLVASSIQPFVNIQVQKYIEDRFGSNEKKGLAKHQYKIGFAALEKLLEQHATKYATGDQVSLADVYLAPEIDCAIKLFDIDMNGFPLLKRLYDSCYQLSTFRDTVIEAQPDAPDE